MATIARLIETTFPGGGAAIPVADWLRIARERRALAAMDERQLADLGLTPREAAAEAARPFWDLPRGR